MSKLPVNARSADWLSHMLPTRRLHPDFGPSYGAQSVPYGIPITFVSGTHATSLVHFLYASESDRSPYPLGRDTEIEGGQKTSGDRHAVLVDRTSCRLYETYATHFPGTSDSRWSEAVMSDLKRIPASAFEAVDASRLQISANSGQAR